MSDAAEATEGTEFAHEVRLGLVLYGGVSLAIYMNGTTNELHRAVRGRGVYYLIKHLLDADITVDVASGASAGGINGIFLSFALANEREFGTCADLWRRDGDLGGLLRTLEGETAPSVLDSEHYRGVLENGFRVMWHNEDHSSEPERPSRTRELDLFVTGTNFYGCHAQAVDSTGRVIETKQHRTVFLLKHRHRKDSKCQLDPRRDAYGRWNGAKLVTPSSGADSVEEPENPPEPDAGLLAFAKLAQITSCFPGAFAAVHVDAAGQGAGTPTSEADQRLKVWGDLPVGEHYFVDGGVLDNKPFTTTLDAIFHRPADRRVCRHVLYLEPDPERFAAEKRDQLDGEGRLVAPSFVSSVLDSVTRLPSYESIADDLARIAEHNASIQRFDRLVEGLDDNGGAPPSQATYLAVRLLAVGQRVNVELAEALASVEFVPAGGDPREKTRLTSDEIGKLLEKLRAELQGFPAAARKALLDKLDVDFHVRRLLSLTYVLEKRSDRDEARQLWKLVNQEIQWLEIVRNAMERVVVPPWIWRGGEGFDEKVDRVDAAALWSEIERRTWMLLDSSALERDAPVSEYPARGAVTGALRETMRRKDDEREQLRKWLDARIVGLGKVDQERLPPGAPASTLLEDSNARMKKLVDASPDYVKSFWQSFEQREDALRFPLEFAARVHQRDEIKVVRLSPFDAQTGFSGRAFEDKICGETFGHFGAFLKRSWRSNDILWGRLDGISRLVETLLLHTGFGGTTAPKRGDSVLAALGTDDAERRAFLGKLFPHLEKRFSAHAKSGSADPLAALLDALKAPLPAEPHALVKLLTETAQLDALCEDLPKVIADAAEEQLEWGERRVNGRKTEDREPGADDREARKLRKLAAKAEANARRARAGARAAAAIASDAEVAARKARAKVPSAPRVPPSDGETPAPRVRFSAEAWQFETSPPVLDASVLNLATRRFAEDSLSEMNPHEVGRYFRQDYAVGSESAFLAIPVTVLADLGARTAVLAEHALVGGGGGVGETLRKNGLYRLIVHFPIRTIAALAAFLRRSPQYKISYVVGAVLYAALAIVANVVLAGALYEKDGLGRTFAIWVFALLPLTALVFAWVLWRSPIGKRVLIGSVVVLVAFALWWKRTDLATFIHDKCENSCASLAPTPSTDAECAQARK